jgi:laccase
MGMAAAFIVEDGPTTNTSLPPPPLHFPSQSRNDNLVPNQYHIQTLEIKTLHIDGI